MKKIFFLIAIFLLFNSCSSYQTSKLSISSEGLESTKFTKEQLSHSGLSEKIPLKIYVEDLRPKVEVEKKPTTEFVYSGSLFNLEDNLKIIAEDLSQISIKYGATQYQIVDNIPTDGPSIVLILENWYSKISKLQENDSFITVYGLFAGKIEMRYDNMVLASMNFREEGEPVTVPTYTKNKKQKEELPTLIWNAMLTKANSAQQYAYVKIFDFLQKNWSKFQS